MSICNFDLVDQCIWEDILEESGEFLTLEEAGLEDSPVYDTVPGSQREYFSDEY